MSKIRLTEIDASAKSWGKIVVTKIGNSFTPYGLNYFKHLPEIDR